MVTMLKSVAVIIGMLGQSVTVKVDAGNAADWVSGLGSLAAVTVALYGFRIVAKQRAADRKDNERAVAYDLVATVLDMANHIRGIEHHIKTQRNDIVVKQNETVRARYHVLNPLIGLSTEGDIQLPARSTEILIKADAVTLWNDVRLLANRNRSITSLFKEYQRIWQSMVDKMPAPEGFTGTVGHFSAEQKDLLAVEGDLVRIDHVVKSLEEQVRDTATLLTRVSSEIGPVMRRYFDEPFIHLGSPEESEVAKSESAR